MLWKGVSVIYISNRLYNFGAFMWSGHLKQTNLDQSRKFLRHVLNIT